MFRLPLGWRGLAGGRWARVAIGRCVVGGHGERGLFYGEQGMKWGAYGDRGVWQWGWGGVSKTRAHDIEGHELPAEWV